MVDVSRLEECGHPEDSFDWYQFHMQRLLRLNRKSEALGVLYFIRMVQAAARFEQSKTAAVGV